MLKFGIIGDLNENAQDLLNAIEKAGHSGEVLKFSEITFETIDGDLTVMHGEQDVCDFDVVIFRGYNNHIYEAQLLAEMLEDKDKTVIEQSLSGGYVRGKMHQAKRLLECGIDHPATFQANNFEGWKRLAQDVEFPIIAKPIFGRKGRGIQKLNTKEEALEFFQSNYKDYLAQQYFPIVSDFRIFVVGGEVVGGFQRFINEGQYKSNIHGTRAEKIVVSEEMEKVALESTDAMGYEIAGVDLFEHEGKIYVIEVNVSPQWEKFKLITGINPAEHIVKYAIEKHTKK
ncbi:MAG: Ribosomal protein S6 modification protein (RimK) [Candidatus Moranbacteria bacterium GW2011_GWE1_36_7]|nr:MAG: Ribosomal protein S6 modification protein (RimK) [Candidatus Moranbacteria bacterium GW2011_GWD2_36_12]KKQ06732.1 MAG: Ribosomal protein S6 modification protein (RimK) [Candidatus Moranbacteria bacterium GW2011_GWE2_36_40]KKQ14772.1 MAG: Ribosomal protein S6 modification protein (RimK) [Candidatus Moranbacteria bacterium GW2011_GWE1_36_7]